MKLRLILCLGVYLAFNQCSREFFAEDNTGFETYPTTFAGEDVVAIKGKLTADYIFKGDVKYLLSGSVYVTSGVTAVVEQGARFYAQNRTYFMVEKGGKIMAEGTETHPIIFTSAKELEQKAERGDWGGLFILGRATVNNQFSKEEYTGYRYAGDVNDDSSGVLKYVHILYSGSRIDSTRESNGLTLAGVGSRTTISDVYIAMGADDGVEFFGGTVNVKNIVVNLVEDDAIDWTYGYTGTIQNVVLLLDENSDNGFEGSNHDSITPYTPISKPTVKGDIIISYGGGGISPLSVPVELNGGSKGRFETVSLFLANDAILEVGIKVAGMYSLSYIGEQVDVLRLNFGTNHGGMVKEYFSHTSERQLTAQKHEIGTYNLSYPQWSDWVLKK